MNNEIITASRRLEVLAWFSGKAYENAAAALNLLAESEVRGEWVPKASRSVRAALSKANRAAKLGRAHRQGLEAIGGYDVPGSQRGWEVAFQLSYGPRTAVSIDWAAVRAGAPTTELAHVVDQARIFVDALLPVIQLLNRLDATRPKPVITSIGASPTVTSLLTNLGVAATADTVRVCPIEYRLETRLSPKGATYSEWVGHLIWPADTVHGASRYDHTHSNAQCQACGHAIKNGSNWVPLLLDNAAGIPHSLWVGKDCSRAIFGLDVKGDVVLDQEAA